MIINIDKPQAGNGVCTHMFQSAIDKCHKNGGGTVNIGAGKYITGTLRLKSDVELHLEHGAILKASSDLDDYNSADEYPQNFDCPAEKWCGKHLIIALEQQNVAITGTGTIEGCAESFYGGELHKLSNCFYREGYYEIPEGSAHRPGPLICFVECSHVIVKDVTIRNSTCWNLLLHGCDYVKVSGISIFNDKRHVNSDGIDIDSCSFVTVSDCIIDTGDDCIAIRGDAEQLKNKDRQCEYVTISNCVFSNSTCAVRIGVGVGKIHHVNISDITIARSGEGLVFMTGWRGIGSVEITDIIINNICGDDVATPIQMYAEEADIKRVKITNYHTNCKCGIRIISKKSRIYNLTLKDFDIYDVSPDVIVPGKLAEERMNAIITADGVNGLMADNVCIHTLDSYFDDREKIAEIENCKISGCNIRYIHRGEEIFMDI